MRERPVEVEDECSTVPIRGGSLLCSCDAARGVHPRPRGGLPARVLEPAPRAGARHRERHRGRAARGRRRVRAGDRAALATSTGRVWPFIASRRCCSSSTSRCSRPRTAGRSSRSCTRSRAGVAPAIVLVVGVAVLGDGDVGRRRSPGSSSSAPACCSSGAWKPPRSRTRSGSRSAIARGDRLVHAARQARDPLREPDHLPRAEHDPGRARLCSHGARGPRPGARAGGARAPRPIARRTARRSRAYALVLAALARASGRVRWRRCARRAW